MLSLLKTVEGLMIRLLTVLMVIVLTLAIIDLSWTVLKSVSQPPYLVISVDQLLDLFGLFMLVMIGIELLETMMRTYLSHGTPHFEVVLSVAIIAIARKVIIMDIKDIDGLKLAGIAAIILALTAGYYLMRKAATCPSEPESAPRQGKQ